MKYRFTILAVTLFVSLWCWGQPPSGAGTPPAQAANPQNANNVCRVFFVTPKPGAASQLEQARQKHMQFHKRQNDAWTWNTWVIETGDNTGSYVTSTCGHAWKDFDDWDKRLGKADAADATAGMGPFEQSSTNRFYLYRADLSLAQPTNPPSPMTAVTVYVLHPLSTTNFEDAITKINAALNKQPNWPKNFRLVAVGKWRRRANFCAADLSPGLGGLRAPAKNCSRYRNRSVWQRWRGCYLQRDP